LKVTTEQCLNFKDIFSSFGCVFESKDQIGMQSQFGWTLIHF